jgi:hypothetical protein
VISGDLLPWGNVLCGPRTYSPTATTAAGLPCPVNADRLARFIVSVADYLFERRRCDGKPIDRQATLRGRLAAVRVR